MLLLVTSALICAVLAVFAATPASREAPSPDQTYWERARGAHPAPVFFLMLAAGIMVGFIAEEMPKAAILLVDRFVV